MVRRIITILIILSLVFSTIVGFTYKDSTHHTKVVKSESVILKNINREINRNVFEKINETREILETSKNITIEERIRIACINYEIPFDITLAIARLETGWFKSDAYIYGNNPGGLSINEVPMSFETIEEGVDAFVGNLANNYFAMGLDTPEKIGAKYCPVNPNWVNIVSEMMTYDY